MVDVIVLALVSENSDSLTSNHDQSERKNRELKNNM